MGEQEKARDPNLEDEFGDETKDDEEEKTGDHEGGEAQTSATALAEESWTKDAALDERRRRQAAEGQLGEAMQRLAHLEGRFATIEQRPPTPDENDFGEVDYADLGPSIAKIATRAASKAVEKNERSQKSANSAEWGNRVRESLELARMKHDDFDSVYEDYLALERNDRELARAVMSKSDPAEWAYHWTKNRQRGEGSEGEMAKLKQELAEARAIIAGEAPPKKRRSLAGATGSGARPKIPSQAISEEEAFEGAFEE